MDDLGRVVIPKEIRRTMRMREGERHRQRWNRGSASATRCWHWQKGRVGAHKRR